MQNRNQEIDMMKGIGILLMVFNHCPVDIYFLHRFIEIFHMPLFFLLSGYLYKEKTIKDLLRRNARFILKPYFVTMAFVCICLTLNHVDTLWGGVILLGNSRSTLGFDNCYEVGPLWFLTAFFMTMIYAHFLFKIRNEIFRGVVVLVLFSLSVLYMLFVGTMTPFGTTSAFGGLLFLYIGYCVRTYKECFYSLSVRFKYCFLALCSLCYVVSLLMGYNPMSWHIYKLWYIDVIGAVFGTYLCYRFVNSLKLQSPISRFLSFCGLNSLAILCIHSIDFLLKITSTISNALPVDDLQRWQIEVFLKFSFVAIAFSVLYMIKPLRNLYNIQKL